MDIEFPDYCGNENCNICNQIVIPLSFWFKRNDDLAIPFAAYKIEFNNINNLKYDDNIPPLEEIDLTTELYNNYKNPVNSANLINYMLIGMNALKYLK